MTSPVLIALDDLGSAILFKRTDLCISTLCDMVLVGDDAQLNLSARQRAFLKVTGQLLNWKWPGHTAGSRQGDINRAESTLTTLGVPLRTGPLEQLKQNVASPPAR